MQLHSVVFTDSEIAAMKTTIEQGDVVASMVLLHELRELLKSYDLPNDLLDELVEDIDKRALVAKALENIYFWFADETGNDDPVAAGYVSVSVAMLQNT